VSISGWLLCSGVPPVLCANVIGATSSESALVSVRLSVFHASHPAAPEIAAPSRKPLRRVAVFSYCESVRPDSLLLLLSMSVSTFIFFCFTLFSLSFPCGRLS